MKKSLLELQCLEEKKLYEELKKIENAEENYKITTLYKKLAIMVFILNFIIVTCAAVCDRILITRNDTIVSLVILLFTIVSLSLLIISNFYKEKTMKILYNYYEKEKVLE